MQINVLEATVDEAVSGLDRHLLQTMFMQYNLRQHCDALKRYMLLGQGDFIETLMDLVGGRLSQQVCFPHLICIQSDDMATHLSVRDQTSANTVCCCGAM